MTKFSGKHRQYATGAVRDSGEGKGRYDLIPTRAMRRVALRYQEGGKLHGENNWRKGMPLRDFLDCAKRHIDEILEGRIDEDHAAAAAWNILSFMETEERIKAGYLPQTLNNVLKLEE